MRNSHPVNRRSHGQDLKFSLIEQLELRQFLSTTVPNIMPLGDSITEEFSGHASYRYWLWNSLADAGYTADFVGTGLGVADGPPLFPGFDLDHEGHSGFRADDIQSMLESAGWKSFASQATNKPKIVLLHIGSNDLEQGQTAASTRNEIGKIIDDLRVINPNVTVLLSQIIPEAAVDVSGLNSLLPALATAKNTTQSRVILVDQFTGFSANTDTYDGVHPNEAGEKKIAAKFFDALKALLPAPTPPPAGTYLDTPAVPLTNASNAIGPVEYEMSNGADSLDDGQMLSLRGKTYMRGFGVHAPAELDFNLAGGTYSNFRAIVGVDDESDGNGSVIFQVFVNNETTPRYASPSLTGADAAVSVDVNISGATKLRLVVTDGGNDNDFDHADWIQARLIAGTPPVSPPPAPSPEAPAAPQKLHAKFKGKRVELNWQDVANNETGFSVERKDGATGTWQQIATLGANVHCYRDTNLAAGKHYFYRVSAFNDDGSSIASNVADVATPPRKKVKIKIPKVEFKNDHAELVKLINKVKAVIKRILHIGGDD